MKQELQREREPSIEARLARHFAAQKKYLRRQEEAIDQRDKELARLLYEENRTAYQRAYHELYGSHPYIEVNENGR